MLAGADNILILYHQHPDGDAWGSAFALFAALKKMGRRVRVGRGNDIIPQLYSYMGDYCVAAEDDVSSPAFVVSVDCGNAERLSEGVMAVDLSIDHHGSNTMYAKSTLLDQASASCCEIVYKVIKKLGVSVDPYIADCLYTGISTDTGCFKFSNTTSSTHRAAAALIDCGANIKGINVAMFDTKTRARISLEGEVTNGMRFFENGKIAVALISLKAFERSGAIETDAEGIASLSRAIEGVEFGITLREKPGYYKCSVRTTNTNACAVASHFGGGGHIRASGFESTVPLEKLIDEIVSECKKQL